MITSLKLKLYHLILLGQADLERVRFTFYVPRADLGSTRVDRALKYRSIDEKSWLRESCRIFEIVLTGVPKAPEREDQCFMPKTGAKSRQNLSINEVHVHKYPR